MPLSWEFLTPLRIVEILGVLTGLVCVWLYIREKVSAWPLTILSASLFIVLFLDARLYANAGLQVFFIVLALYGWRQWQRGGAEKTGVSVSRITRNVAVLLLLLTATASALFTFVLGSATNAAEPLWDSLATTMSLAAQWMLARKILENWLVWIAADIIFAVVYVQSALYVTAGLYAVYLVMATAGFLTWRRSLGNPDVSAR